MQSVSNAWKSLYTKSVLPESKIEINIKTANETLTFTNADIIDLAVDLSCDLCSLSLPTAKITITFDNSNGAWNADVVGGYYSKLESQQLVTARFGYIIGGSTEWISGGTYCLSKWVTNRQEQTATITAVDFIQAYLIPKQFVYNGGMWGWQTPRDFPSNMPSTSRYIEFDEYVCDYYSSFVGLPTASGGAPRLRVGAMEYNEYLIGGDYEWVYVYPRLQSGKTPANSEMNNYNCAEILQFIANSSCGMPTYTGTPRLFEMYLTRDGFIDIKARDQTLQDYNINAFNTYEYNIEREPNLQQLDFEFNCFGAYSTPRKYTSTRTLDATGKIITNTNPNGEQYNGSLEYGDASPIPTHAENYIADILINKLVVTGEMRADPRLDVGDKVTFSASGTSYSAYITDLKYKYNGMWKASFQGRIIENGI